MIKNLGACLAVDDNYLKQEACRALANLAHQNTNNQQKIAEVDGLLEQLKNCLASPGINVQHAACRALVNLAVHKDFREIIANQPEILERLITCFDKIMENDFKKLIIDILTKIAHDNKDKIRQCAYESLNNYLANNEELRKKIQNLLEIISPISVANIIN